MAVKNYVGGDRNFAAAAAWTPKGAPQPGDSLFIDSGTVTAAGQNIQSTSITMEKGNPFLILQNSTLDAASSITGIGQDITQAPHVESKGKTTNAGHITNTNAAMSIDVLSGTFTNAQGGVIADQASQSADLLAINGKVDNQGTIIAHGDAFVPATIDQSGALNNEGLIEADNGATVNLAPDGNLQNSGTLLATDEAAYMRYNNTSSLNVTLGNGATLNNTGTISSTGGPFISTTLSVTGGTLKNTGVINNQSQMTLNTAVTENKAGTFTNSGHLTIDQAVSGNGTIQLTSGMIEFGGPPLPQFIGTQSSRDFSVNLDLSKAATASLQFDNTTNVWAVLTPKNVLDVFALVGRGGESQVAAIQLTGGAYTQNEFTSQGGSIVFTHI